MIEVIAHRGLRNEFPENSIAAIKGALSVPGISGIEFDVELTKDGRTIIVHQETFAPNPAFTKLELAARDLTSRDWVGKHTFEEVSHLDAGSWFGSQFAELGMPMLQDVLTLNWGSCIAFIELIDSTYWTTRDRDRPTRLVQAVLPDLSECKSPLNIVSFNHEVLREMQQEMPHLPRTLAVWIDRKSEIREVFKEALTSGAKTISVADSMILNDPQWLDERRSMAWQFTRTLFLQH